MGSPLKRQRDAILERIANNTKSVAHVDSVSGELSASSNSLHIALVEFEQDKLALKELASISQKIDHKRSVLIPKYQPMVEAYLESGENYENPMFSDLIVWLFDVEEFETAMAWCEQAIASNIPTPERFKCAWPTFVVRSVFEWAEKQYKLGQSFQPYYDIVDEKLESKEWEVPEKQYGPWLKFAAYALITNDDGKVKPSHIGKVEDLEKAQALMEKARNVYIKVGVDTKLGEVKARIKALQTGNNL
ncbi:phage terminase small subunit [Vibrio sp. 10N.261.55.A7]|uniref:phage terminase small subunit n=1 Tax=Vibrio sp. 10N.261.55.A7 TaxID=1880851 RepID=UPI000C83FBBE|nr:phage terminase small subunit [Vibrio sp. 10N.261.55.A7]PMJ92852.1 terminase [Vibrio sp. 10N.261.55.A7]